MKVAVVGSGYVGLVAGAGFASSGNQVVCVDNDARKIERLREGVIPIYEPGLDRLVMDNVKEGRITFSTDTATAVKASQVVFIAVGTPPEEDGSADLSYVLAVARDIANSMEDYKVVVLKSTVPVGTNEKVTAAMTALTKLPFDVVNNPEFLKEGAAIEDFMKPDRVVVGTRSERAREVMKELYEPFLRNNNPIIFMDEKSAEMTKYAANAMLATRITFMNEVANLCDLVGADVDMVRKGIGSDPRIGKSFLFPGVGFGGSCFPKDVMALSKTSKDFGYTMEILEAVHSVNEAQKHRLSKKVVARFGEDLSGLHFGIWGLAFKPNTDDMREAPSRVIINDLLSRGATVTAYDPAATETAREVLGDSIIYADKAWKAAEKADALLIVTEWGEFRTPDFELLGRLLNGKVIFDGRNLYDPARVKAQGFEYHTIGRGIVRP